MTVIYTETHLDSDPIFILDMVQFDIALSQHIVQCRVHRQEIIEFIRANKVRAGDLVRLYGVFMTEKRPNSAAEINYMNINGFALVNEFDVKPGKKRKVEQLFNDPSLICEKKENRLDDQCYVEVTGDFRDYFFMLYGRTHYTWQFVMNYHKTSLSSMNELDRSKMLAELKQLESSNMMNYMLLQQIYHTYVDMMELGMSKANILLFVELVKDITEKTCRLRIAESGLPPGLVIDRRVYLPSNVYHYYASLV